MALIFHALIGLHVIDDRSKHRSASKVKIRGKTRNKCLVGYRRLIVFTSCGFILM